MMKTVTVLAAALAFASATPSPVSNVFEIDISPEEAQKYLNSPPFTEPQLSGRTGVLPLVRWNDPRFRTAEAGPTLGHYWKNGHEIENTDDYVEEVYDASQFHGQDGLGGYAYGYQAPESSKVENRARSGDVTGSYTYKDGNNELIKVRYWADSEGFHQEDNLPKVELQPAQETEEVREARLAHEKAWQEAAAAAAQQPDPQGEYSANHEYQGSLSGPQAIAHGYQASAQHGFSGAAQSYQASASAPQGVVAPATGYQSSASAPTPAYQAAASEQQSVLAPAPAREGKAYYSAQAQSYQGTQQYGQQQKEQQYGQGQQHGHGQQSQGNSEEPEPTGPPRGFFYSFNYPVSIIVAKNAGQGGPVNPGHPVDHDTVSVNAQQRG